MHPSDFFTASRVLIVAGKGGVGKTTVAATLGVAASRLGIDTLLVEIEGKHGLAGLFDGPELTYDDTELRAADPASGQGRLRARTVRADAALLDYLKDNGLSGFARTLDRLHVLDTLATSTPGLKDLIVMGKIKQLENSGDARLIIVDAPASGHAISFLRAARRLQETIDTGPIRRQADDVVEMLTDPARAQVLLVTLAEETPVNELVETAYALEDEVGVLLGPAVVNGVYPEPEVGSAVSRSKKLSADVAAAAARATEYWRGRAASQTAQMARLAEELPLEQLVLSQRFSAHLGPVDLEHLASELLAQIEALRFEAAS